jgi:hypothetical protein
MAAKSKRREREVEAQKGAAQGGESINPSALPEESDVESQDKCRVAPAPGLPISQEEYERLKEAAKTSATPPLENAQEDRPPKKKLKKR